MGCGRIYENMLGEEIICGTFNDAGNRRICKECTELNDKKNVKREIDE